MFVVTDWMAKQMHDLGYLQEINLADMPNVDANLRDDLRSPPFDPERTFSVPWQSGLAGPDRQQEARPGHPLGERPVRPPVQGQGHGARPRCATPFR